MAPGSKAVHTKSMGSKVLLRTQQPVCARNK
jgi:hypothetical protein